MRFVWFWTFWHWSRESFRDGRLLRTPLSGVGSHWDEWFRHEASENERQAIAAAGQEEATQRQFIAWLFRRWARETPWRANRMVPRFVLGQLAQLPPFNRWPALATYRENYGVGGISAVVLGTESPGRAEDVRTVEALALPTGAASLIVPEGFQADAGALETARRAATSLLRGKGLLIFLALWMVSGQRPYPRWLRVSLALGWGAVGGLILYLLLGPDPGERLFQWSATLMALWGGLVLGAVAVVLGQSVGAWREGTRLAARLEASEVRLRLNGGMTLQGESAGLAFCLNTLLSVSRTEPGAGGQSGLWQRFFRRLRAGRGRWAATGVVTDDGFVKPVVVEPKLRACLDHAGIGTILTPRQANADQRAINRLAGTPVTTGPGREKAPPGARALPVGWAAEKPRLVSHRCRHVAQAMMAFGGFTSGWQRAVTALAVVVSGVMLFAFPDLIYILAPPPAPAAVAPSSPSPQYLWVSLDTRHPGCFQVVLESEHWANRRADVFSYGAADVPARAEILLRRLSRPAVRKEEAATVWIERRHRFLNREYVSGERVGRYSLPYLNRLGHE